MTAQDFADKTWLVMASRISMLLTGPGAAVLVFFGSQWLDARFTAQSIATQAVVERVQNLENDNLPTRLSVLESTILNKGIARDAQFSAMTAQQISQGAKLDKLVDAVGALSGEVAGLNATMNAQRIRP